MSSQHAEKSSKTVQVYNVVISSGDRKLSIDRRYEDFQCLYENLLSRYPNDTPQLPSEKKYLFHGESKQLGEALYAFVTSLCANPNLCELKEVQDFLEMDEQSFESVYRKPYNRQLLAANKALESGMRHLAFPPRVKDPAVSINLGSTEKHDARPEDLEFLKVIGKGTFGEVYLTKIQKDGSLCAVKVLSKSRVKLATLAQKSGLVKSIRHPFVVGLNYSFQSRDNIYFVFPYATGGALFSILQQKKRFRESKARFYAAEIACAIGYLHSLNIICGDMSFEENILLDTDGHVLLTDFGLRKDCVENKQAPSNYSSPERLAHPVYDRPMDWWTLGCIIFEMMFGSAPFHHADRGMMLWNIEHRAVELCSNVPYSPAAKSILVEILRKKAALRLGTARDFYEITAHRFFSAINWTQLEEKKIRPPYKPEPKDEQYFVRDEKIPDSITGSVSSPKRL